MSTALAIPTTYQGVEFRSRLEARWALFLDTLGIKWLYEHEGYQLPSGWYVPDFFLPTFIHPPGGPYAKGLYVEIKPTEPSPLETSLIGELVEARKVPGLLLHGEVALQLHDGIAFGLHSDGRWWMNPGMHWGYCSACRHTGVGIDRQRCQCGIGHRDCQATPIKNAFTIAQKHRFW